MRNIMWVKFGWSEYYRGGPVNGNFRWLNEGDGEGHEAFNFLPGPDGGYYCYVPPHGPHAASPSSSDPHGWTVICLAKFPSQKGVHVVGWYENATLMGKEIPRPEYKAGVGFRRDVQGATFSYSIKADSAFFVPPEARTMPFSHPSVKQAKFSYLTGPDVDTNPAKAEVFAILESELGRLRPLTIAQPNPANAPDELEDDIDPLGRFGTPEHRRNVELAAERAVTAELDRLGYHVIRRSDEKIGYDLQAIAKQGGSELYVEVKGTSGADRRFYMTPKEREFTSTDSWRLAMVTDALSNPDVTFFTCKQMEQRFSLQPMVWIGREVEGVE
ncbi:DUF3883 domain-containing protein (plasmid) [Rhizobium leguminosarum]|nr:DUF3883 domain-containing protein [Rhizobium leguminosarum]TAZ02900.1 DUF3883 domain-containing protein [Rhizobium leguminosarum]